MNPIHKLNRLAAVACSSVVAALVTGGCVGTAPRPDFPTRIEAATGLGTGAVVFHSTAEPVDAGGPVSTLTITSAVRLAVEHDSRIQTAAARVRTALADAGQSRLLPNPVLNVAVMLPEGGGRPVINASLSEDLLALLTLPKRGSAADHRLRAASADAQPGT